MPLKRVQVLIALVFFAFASRQRALGGNPGSISACISIDKFDPNVKVLEHATSMTKLLESIKPDFVGPKGDLLWITHDPKGHVGFKMNHAYQLSVASAPTGVYLLGGDEFV